MTDVCFAWKRESAVLGHTEDESFAFPVPPTMDQAGVSLSGELPMRDIEGSYRALLAVINVLYSQRDTDSLWQAITEQIRKVLPWERAGITLYNQKSDSLRFYAVETSMPTRFLQRGRLGL